MTDRQNLPEEQNPFPDETAYLEMIMGRLDEALKEANDSVERIDREYRDAKQYMADCRGEIDPHEMFQNELALKQIDRTGAFAVDVWSRLARLKDSPYFARIDFREKDRQKAAQYYIGRFAFHRENELLIFDWRAPVAGMFYDCEVGPAGYEAPSGRIEGELTRKRQFKIKNGVLEYALESSVHIGDDVLQRELSHTSDEKMKSIISTIQKEQNQIIRDENTNTMIIQGVAGSGKTSIALHRIAFLLYRFKDRLSAANIMILSPNRVFGDYISTVLPELGEEPVCEFGFKDIAQVQLEGIVSFDKNRDPLEFSDGEWEERVRFKSTLDFVRLLDQYLGEMPQTVFQPEDYVFGSFTAKADWIRMRFGACEGMPVKKRLERIAEDIHDRFDSDNYMGDRVPGVRTILKSLNSMLVIKNSLALYRNFYQWLGYPHMLVMPGKKALEWADVSPFLYLHSAFEGIRESRRISHLVIDEMQDYTPVQYAVINRLFPCPKTILGDYGQFINPFHRHTLKDLMQIYHDGRLVELTKSYRSTYEIITFAKKIQRAGKLEPMERHGEAPQITACRDEAEKLDRIRRRLKDFSESGYASCGIIVKTGQAAKELYKLLAGEFRVQLISEESTRFMNGISVTSIRMSKGLEFDEVIVADAGDDVYHTEYDRSLLYIASTRAMHRLTMFYAGKPSRLLP